MDAAVQGLMMVLSPNALLMLFIGVAFGLVIGFLPGMGGVIAMSLLLPFIYNMELGPAICLLWGAHVAVTQGGSISAILFNVPGTTKNIATCFDGYPMARKGEAERALAASGASSVIGGIMGALVLTFFIPVMRAIVLSLGAPEYFWLAFWGLSVIAVMTSGSVFKGMTAASLGMMISFIGNNAITGSARYAFGSIYLADGIAFAPAVIGLFAISSMFELYTEGGSIAMKRDTAHGAGGGAMQGVRDVFQNWSLTLRSAVLGVVIGVLPGVGGTVGNILAYGQATQTMPGKKWGTGIVEGVIAPEAAVSANEGGGLVTTLGFGIPGGEGPAILLMAFIIMGIAPGPEMLDKNLPLVLAMVWIIVLANLIGSAVLIFGARWMAKITVLPSGILIPLVLVFCAVGSFAINRSFLDVLVMLLMAFLGYYMKKNDFSRANLVIGLVMGRMVERYFHIAIRLYSPDAFFTRPIALIFFLIVVATILLPVILARRNKTKGMVI
jgi:putative tricarboxylic transport membrane protein